MNIRPITPIIALFCALTAASGTIRAQTAAETTDDVTITFASERDTMSPGGDGAFLVRFAPGKGFHVNAVPPMSLALDSAAGANLLDTLSVPRDTATGYLDTRSPVRQPFIMKKRLKPGTSVLSGTLTYYYCSDSEGWCRREKKPFTVAVTVK